MNPKDLRDFYPLPEPPAQGVRQPQGKEGFEEQVEAENRASTENLASRGVEGETLPGSSGGQQAPGPAGGESEEKTCVPFSSAAGARGKPRRERSGALEALMLVLSAFLLALTLKTYVAEAYEIKGRSMEETFSDGQRVVVLKAFYALQRGDIVVFASSEDPGKDLIKRVVGLPGEVVQIRRGGVYINGKRLEEDYLKPNARGRYETTREPVRLDPNCYYVLGDNRPDSHDSRYFGEVPKGSIKGKVVVRWWPFSMFKSF